MSVEVYSCDKIGHFIGNLYIPGAKESLCLSLLKQGCVNINAKAIGFCSSADAMAEAEDEAKEARRIAVEKALEEESKKREEVEAVAWRDA